MSELKSMITTTYQKRQAINRGYSQNAFARDLGVSPTALSQYLSGKRSLSPVNLKKVVRSLALPLEYAQKSKRNNYADQTPSIKLKIDTFTLISDWYHFGILNLLEIELIRSPEQICKRLGISLQTAIEALDRLESLALIKKNGGRYIRATQSLDTGSDIPSEAIRKHNREKMELAIASLETVSIQLRDISSLTLTFNPQKLNEIKKEIVKFKNRVTNLCNNSENSSEVYALNVQFFPLSKQESLK